LSSPFDRVRDALPAEVRHLAEDVARAGGTLLVVGGWLRDTLRGETSQDLDLEIHGLAVDRITGLLGAKGFTPPVGRQFAVWRHTGLGLDVGLPHVTPGTTSLEASGPGAIEAALRGRDLTINAMAWDPRTDRLFDPLGGHADLRAGVLRAADPARFGEDPLRVLRTARLAAMLEATVDPELARQAHSLDLSALPVERVAGELRRILSLKQRPWRAIETLRALGQLHVFPLIAALEGVPQDPLWHPEGDVFVHTGLVVDRAASLAEGLSAERAEVLLWAALCHDLGKPSATQVGEEGRVRSLGHDVRGAALTLDWLESLRLGTTITRAVSTLVRHHLAPALFVGQEAGPRAYRRLARKLAADGLDMTDLERVARADHLGRTTEAARLGRFEAGDRFLERAEAARVSHGVRPDVVRAADWMRRGVAPGPVLGELLELAREIQDETGWEDSERIMRQVARVAHGEARRVARQVISGRASD
jgi:tRNA nucleotidyltransferase (CCA-adding enzyme)